MDWCSQAVLPTAVAFLHWLHESDSSFPLVLPPSSTANETPFRYPRALLLITTISSIVALLQPFTSSPVLALSLSSAASTSLAYTLIERILGGRGDEGMGKKEDLRPVNGSHANGSRGGRLSVSAPMTQASLGRILQELAVVASIGCGCASLCLETFRFNGVEYRPELENYIGDDWRTGMRYFGMLQALLVAIAAGLKNLVMIALVSSLHTASIRHKGRRHPRSYCTPIFPYSTGFEPVPLQESSVHNRSRSFASTLKSTLFLRPIGCYPGECLLRLLLGM